MLRTVPASAYTRFTAPALHHLTVAAAHCVALGRRPPGPDGDVEVERRLHTLFVHLLRCEAARVDPADVDLAVAPVRALVAASPLFARLQRVAPGGVPDHATVACLCGDAGSTAACGTLARLLDEYLLESPIALQLRNRIVWREALLLETLLARGGAGARALVLGAGPALDVRAAADRVRFAPDQLTVHDPDPRALAGAMRRLGGHAAGVRFVTGESLRAAADLAAAPPFDLVLVGDVLDAMEDAEAAALLRIVHETLLAPGGRLAFAAASAADPLRPCLEHLTAWRPVRRTPGDVAALLAGAGFGGAPLVTRDMTGLAILAEVTRRGAGRRAA